jgi:hypothetical protein
MRRLRVRPRHAYLTLALLGAFAAVMLAAAVRHWDLVDLSAYLGAADRIVHGQSMYPTGYDPDGAATYRYAPWFAWLFVPLTYVPRSVVEVGWSIALIGSLLYVGWRLTRLGLTGVALALILVPLLAMTASYGNIQPILVALLVARPGWVSVGIAGGLKVTPVLLAAAWWGNWSRVIAAVALTAMLWAPALLYDLSAYPTDPGSPLLSFPLWLHGLLAALLLLAVPWAGRHRALLAALAVMVAMPRMHLYDATFLIVAAVGLSGQERSSSTSLSSR